MKTKKINFLMVFHYHQPIGVSEKATESAYQQAYLPLIETLEKHPSIKTALHFSGILWEYFLKKHPEFIEKIQELLDKNQLELLSSGFYEPIIPLIPDRDKVGQIQKQTAFIRKHLNCISRGLWLTAGFWEPHIIKSLVKAETEYTILDETHFTQAGIPEEDLLGYYTTEEEGQIFKIFPTNKILGYLIPLHHPQETIDYLKSQATNQGEKAVVFAGEGEKFGVRPGMHELIYKQKWLENFFVLLEENKDWLNILTFSEHLDAYPARGKTYLGEENNSTWRRYLLKYPESNNMHKKMFLVSDKLQNISSSPDPRLKKARTELWKGQGNSAYGEGIHLKPLRQAVYRHLISAENTIDEITHGKDDWLDLSILDFDKDGQDEVLVRNKSLNIYLSPNLGGTLFELDFRPQMINLADSLSRRFSLVDHFLDLQTTLNSFRSGSHREAGDFAEKPYSFFPKRDNEGISVEFSREGSILHKEKKIPLLISKKITIDKKSSGINIYYEIKNKSPEKIFLWFGPEFNLSSEMGSAGEILTSEITLVDKPSNLKVSLVFEKDIYVWHFPVETTSPEKHYPVRDYQGSTVFPNWKLVLDPEGTWHTNIKLKIKE